MSDEFLRCRTPQSVKCTALLAATLALAGCTPDSQSLISPAALFPAVTVSTTEAIEESEEPTTQPETPIPTETPTEPPTETPTDTNLDTEPTAFPDTPSETTPDTTTPVTPADFQGPDSVSVIPSQLELLTRGTITFAATFSGSGETVNDQLSFTTADFDVTDAGLEVLVALDTTTANISACSFVLNTEEYLCLHSFDLVIAERVWYLFSLDTDRSGGGVFEFCVASDTQDQCAAQLTSTADGTLEVTIESSIAAIELPSAAPYLAYGEQGTSNELNRSNEPSELSGTMNSILNFALSD